MIQDPNNPIAILLREHGQADSEKRMSLEQIANEADLDSGFLRRWARGEGVPASKYLKQLAEALEVPVQLLEKYQQEASVRREKIKDERRKARKRGQEPDLVAATKKVVNVLGGLDVGLKSEEVQNSQDKSAPLDYQNKSVLSTKQDITKAMLAMMERLHVTEADRSKKVFLTFQSASVFRTEKEKNDWRKAVKLALKNGWNIDYLVRLDRNLDRTCEIIASILQFWGYKGKFTAYAFIQDGTLSVADEVFVIEDKEALLALETSKELASEGGIGILESSNQLSSVNVAVYLEAEKNEDGDWIKFLNQHLELRKRVETVEIFSRYDDPAQPDLIAMLSNSDSYRRGDSTIFLRRFSDFTRPWEQYSGELYKKLVKQDLEMHRRRALDKEELSREIKLRRQRYFLDLRQSLKQDRRREIYLESDLNEIILSGRPEPSLLEIDSKALAERFTSMRELIWDESNYEVAILDKSLEKLVDNEIVEWIQNIKPLYFEVKAGIRAFVEVPEEAGERKRAKKGVAQRSLTNWLLAQNPLVVQALQDMLEKFWNQIVDEDKDKFNVIKKLDRMISQLQ